MVSKAKSVELPKGFKPIKGLASSWDYENESPLTGKVTEFRSVESRYKDQKTGKNKVQRNATIARDSDGRLVTVWESAGTRSLFDLKVGTHVWINFDGLRKIKGRAQPMKVFTIAVQS
jgi:hypothetical protein